MKTCYSNFKRNFIPFIGILFVFSLLPARTNAQVITQVVRGTVYDRESQVPLPGANVVVLSTNPVMGAVSDAEGKFRLSQVPVGRHNIQVSFLGYEPYSIQEIMVTSSKEVVLNIELKESATQLNAVEVKAYSNKEQPINAMASISARQLSVEEASRYAGGFDDPARLAAVFAGSSSTMSNNGIVIRGNAPKGLIWRMEGVEISNPSHFADVTTFGAGGITALSSQMLANSDFYTSAFPAEYGNALSGIFDLRIRNGNNEKFEHTVSVGTIGTDISSEGPLGRNSKASYLFNYRYSTFALLAPLLPDDAGGVRYQDFSFKLNFPTKKAGVFSLWGLGANDHSGTKVEEDSADWFYDQDREDSKVYTRNGALGFNHKIIVGKNSYLHTSIAASGNGVSSKTKRMMQSMTLLPVEDIGYDTWKYTLASVFNTKLSARHTNRTGFSANWMFYNFDIAQDEFYTGNLESFTNDDGNSQLLRLYTQSKYDLTKRLSLTAGADYIYFTLNSKSLLEPRASLSWQANARNKFTLGYGLHSQTEILSFYFAEVDHASGKTQPNKSLGFTKAHHWVAGYDVLLSAHSHLKTEVYYQELFDVPVIPGTSFSMLNLDQDWFFSDSLVNKGTGRNYGMDITYERFLNNGFYYLATLSLFDSRYKGGDNIERDTRYNRQYVVNILGGKEWKVGKNNNNILSLNGRVNFTGGGLISPVDEDLSLAHRKVEFDETKAFSERTPDVTYVDLTFSYTKNKAKYSSTWSVKLMNVLGREDFLGYRYNYKTHAIDKEEELTMVPNISYKIEF